MNEGALIFQLELLFLFFRESSKPHPSQPEPQQNQNHSSSYKEVIDLVGFHTECDVDLVTLLIAFE